MQTNTDQHDPEFCRDNYNITLPNGTIGVNPNCRVYPEFEGAPPRVIILCVTGILLCPFNNYCALVVNIHGRVNVCRK